MASEIRIYFEGDSKLRQGFNQFFCDLISAARAKRIKWSLIAGDTRFEAVKDFARALTTHPTAFNILLVDSEDALKTDDPWKHLESLQECRLDKPEGANNDSVQLMVQVMEAWFLMDKQMLQTYYGEGFQLSKLPRTANVENIPKDRIESALNAATEKTKKGRYHKTRHAPDLLQKIDPQAVCATSPWCKRLFDTIERIVSTD